MLTTLIRTFSLLYMRVLRKTSKKRRVKDASSSFGYDTNYPFY